MNGEIKNYTWCSCFSRNSYAIFSYLESMKGTFGIRIFFNCLKNLMLKILVSHIRFIFFK